MRTFISKILFFLLLTTCLAFVPMRALHSVPPPVTQEGCAYDTADIKIFTTDAIKSFNPKQVYLWNNDAKMAIIPLPDKDSIFLQIGGCAVFNYAIAYRTFTDSFTNETYLLEKVKWLTKNFFAMGFESKFETYINARSFYMDTTLSDTHNKTYRILNTDTTILTNQILYGFGIKQQQKQIEIWANGYFE